MIRRPSGARFRGGNGPASSIPPEGSAVRTLHSSRRIGRGSRWTYRRVGRASNCHKYISVDTRGTCWGRLRSMEIPEPLEFEQVCLMLPSRREHHETIGSSLNGSAAGPCAAQSSATPQFFATQCENILIIAMFFPGLPTSHLRLHQDHDIPV